MKFYKIKPVDGFVQLQLKNYDEANNISEFLMQTQPIKNEWNEIEVKKIVKGKKSDFPFFWAGTGMVVVSYQAMEEIKSKFTDSDIEFLPLICDEETYYLVHIINVTNIGYKCNMIEGKIKVQFEREECLKNKVEQSGMFRAYLNGVRPQEEVILTEEFLKIVQESSLKGFDVKEIWNSEEQ